MVAVVVGGGGGGARHTFHIGTKVFTFGCMVLSFHGVGWLASIDRGAMIKGH